MLLLSFLFLVSCFSFLVSPIQAQCPVCIVTVGGGMFLAQRLGVDSLLVSLWISALNTAIAYWLADKSKVKFFKNSYINSLILFITTLAYFQFTNQLSQKITIGLAIGMFTMFFANWFYPYIKAKNGGKTPFAYAKVVIPLVSLLLITLFLKLIFKL